MSVPSQAILVVGGGLGIGLCVTQALLELSPASIKVVVFGLDSAPELSVLADTHAGRLVVVLGDVTKGADRDRTLAVCKTHMGGIDTLVYCAGTMGTIERIDKLDVDSFQRTYEVNVLGLVAMSQACLPMLRAAAARHPTNVACGRLIALSSKCDSSVTYMGWSAYCSSRAAVTRFLAVLAHEERSLSIQAVYPRLTRTRMPGDAIAGRFQGKMADDECETFKAWAARGDAVVEPPAWCGTAVAKLALGHVRGGPSGAALYFDEHVPGSRPSL